MTDKISSSATPIDIIKAINEINNAIPNVGNGTVTFTQDGDSLGSITMNQSGNTTIEIAGASGIVDQEFDPTSIRPQSGVAIAEEGYLKEHQDISHLQLKSNLTTELTNTSTNIQYPGAKTVYDAIHAINTEAHGDWVAKSYDICTTGAGNYNIGDYLPEDAESYWYEVLLHITTYDNISSGDNVCEIRTLNYGTYTLGVVSDKCRRISNTFSLAFPPGSKEVMIPYSVFDLQKKSEFECGHTIGFTRSQAWSSFLIKTLAYRRMGTTPYEYPKYVPMWLWT